MKTKEGNSKMSGCKRNRACVANYRSRPYYSRRCKSRTNIESLPDELVFDILLRLSPKDIHEGARRVCKKWYDMVHTRDFKCEKTFRRSTSGLLIQKSNNEYPFFVAMRKGRLEISKLKYKFRIIGTVWSSCNGLILGFDGKKPNAHALYTLNPATRRRFVLPTSICRRENNSYINYYHSCIAYAEASMEYKVVKTCTCYDRNLPIHVCSILTVGVDKSWRHVSTEHLSSEARELLDDIPCATEGFVHWAHGEKGTRVWGRSLTCVLTLNVETEVITETRVPEGCYGSKTVSYFLPRGRYLTFLVECSEFSWEFWEMEAETGEWTKMPNIDLEARTCEFEESVRKYKYRNVDPRPGGWLNQEVLVLHISPSPVCVVYNVRTQEIDSFEFDYANQYLVFNAHLNRP